VLARHGQTALNASRRVNGDPSVPVELTALGEAEALGLGLQVANIELDVCVHTRFGRTRQTARIALADRTVPLAEEALLDDIDVGDLEGRTIEEYRDWKHRHRRDERFPAGESLDDAARRYAGAFERLLQRPERRVLVVCHEIPIRYALNGSVGSDSLDAPAHDIGNCVPHLFDETGLERAVLGIARLLP
jgi:broad specificity phosphatase PhoE